MKMKPSDVTWTSRYDVAFRPDTSIHDDTDGTGNYSYVLQSRNNMQDTMICGNGDLQANAILNSNKNQ